MKTLAGAVFGTAFVLLAGCAAPVTAVPQASPSVVTPAPGESMDLVRPSGYQCPMGEVIVERAPYPESMSDAIKRSAAVVVGTFRGAQDRILRKSIPRGDGIALVVDDAYTRNVVHVTEVLKGAVRAGTDIVIRQTGWPDCPESDTAYLAEIDADQFVFLLFHQGENGDWGLWSPGLGIWADRKGILSAPRLSPEGTSRTVWYGGSPSDPDGTIHTIDDFRKLVG